MKSYSMQNVVLLVGLPGQAGRRIDGFAEGDDVINVKRLSDLASHKVGADGKMVVSLSMDKSGEITFKLDQTSKANRYMMDIAQCQQAGTSHFKPVFVSLQDKARQDLGSGSVGYIKALPELKRGAKSNDQEWTVVVERLDLFLGDPDYAGLPIAGAEAL